MIRYTLIIIGYAISTISLTMIVATYPWNYYVTKLRIKEFKK